jgi:lipoprotein-anchoring transpeptidase ErfK/SrfK
LLQTVSGTQPGWAGKGLGAALLAAALFVAGAPGTAQAQLFPWGGWNGSSSWEQRPRRPRRVVPRYVEPEEKDPTSTLPKPKGPLLLVVSLGRQTVTVYDGLDKIATSPISSGTRSNPTPTGVYSLLEKNRYHYSNLYGGAPMPFMQRVTNSGVALHAGELPGYPASHGCIRLPYGFARQLFGITDIGARVIITDEDLTPAEFQSARLMAPLPPGNEDAMNSGFSNVVGVTHAAAEVAPKQRTRRMAEAARLTEREELAAAITVAEGGKQSADEHVKVTKDLAREAKDGIHKARKEARRFENAAHKAARDADRTASRFEDLTGKMAKIDVATLEPAELEKQSADELAEEAKVLDLAEAARAAKALAAKQKRKIGKAIAAAEAAEKVHKVARDDAKVAEQTLADAKAALAAAELIEARKDYPVSVFISGKTGRLIAKLGFQEVIDVPVTIADPETPLGTHVLTATAFKDGERAMRWTAVTVKSPSGDPQPRRRKRRRHEDEAYVPRAGEDADPGSALQRIAIPEETRERIAELMKPGSSLIISDYPLSRESSNRTEFVVEPWRSRRHEESREYSYE